MTSTSAAMKIATATMPPQAPVYVEYLHFDNWRKLFTFTSVLIDIQAYCKRGEPGCAKQVRINHRRVVYCTGSNFALVNRQSSGQH
jgi:hypothetical protein